MIEQNVKDRGQAYAGSVRTLPLNCHSLIIERAYEILEEQGLSNSTKATENFSTVFHNDMNVTLILV